MKEKIVGQMLLDQTNKVLDVIEGKIDVIDSIKEFTQCETKDIDVVMARMRNLRKGKPNVGEKEEEVKDKEPDVKPKLKKGKK